MELTWQHSPKTIVVKVKSLQFPPLAALPSPFYLGGHNILSYVSFYDCIMQCRNWNQQKNHSIAKYRNVGSGVLNLKKIAESNIESWIFFQCPFSSSEIFQGPNIEYSLEWHKDLTSSLSPWQIWKRSRWENAQRGRREWSVQRWSSQSERSSRHTPCLRLGIGQKIRRFPDQEIWAPGTLSKKSWKFQQHLLGAFWFFALFVFFEPIFTRPHWDKRSYGPDVALRGPNWP